MTVHALVPIKKESGSDHEISSSNDSAHYPFGTELDFRDKLVDSLGLADVKVGTIVQVIGTAIVTGKSERSSESLGSAGEESQTVSVQLTAVHVAAAEQSKEEVLKLLYPGED